MQSGTYLLSTAYTPTRIMGILAGDEEQSGVTQDSSAATGAAVTNTTVDGTASDTAAEGSANGTSDATSSDGTQEVVEQ